MGVSTQRNGTVEWIGMEWNNGITTPTERGFVATYTHCILQPFVPQQVKTVRGRLTLSRLCDGQSAKATPICM
jgi:hypothetical protein